MERQKNQRVAVATLFLAAVSSAAELCAQTQHDGYRRRSTNHTSYTGLTSSFACKFSSKSCTVALMVAKASTTPRGMSSSGSSLRSTCVDCTPALGGGTPPLRWAVAAASRRRGVSSCGVSPAEESCESSFPASPVRRGNVTVG